MTFMPRVLKERIGAWHYIEQVILEHMSSIESWFRREWLLTPPPLTSSVDIRQAGFKISPVDTNLFPAGFNNLNPEFLPMYVQAAQAVMTEYLPNCTKLLIIPESHTRNHFYLQSLAVLKDIFIKAGALLRLGSLDENLKEATEILLENNQTVRIEPLFRQGDRLELDNFSPCAVMLNNDLSSGIPDILQGLSQPIHPSTSLGWTTRLKSSHFALYNEVVRDFSAVIDIDSWLINPLFDSVDGIDFMEQIGLDDLAERVDLLLAKIREKYKTYGIHEPPFVAVKADNGTYGMSVMMVQQAEELLRLNRKQRTKMSASKGGRHVSRVLIQEGVLSSEVMPDGAVAEPVVYMLGQYVIGGFYRVHQKKGNMENLNSPGMYFEPLTFPQACNSPCGHSKVDDMSNVFYVYGVIARLAALAAAREIKELS